MDPSASSQHECQECGAALPSERILDCHLLESHSVLQQLRRDRGERTLLCLDAACPILFHSERERALHAIEVHLFPPTYRFQVVKSGLYDMGPSTIGRMLRREGVRPTWQLYPELDGSGNVPSEEAQRAWERALRSRGTQQVEEAGQSASALRMSKRKREMDSDEMDEGMEGPDLNSSHATQLIDEGSERCGTARSLEGTMTTTVLDLKPRSVGRQVSRASRPTVAEQDEMRSR